MTSLRTPILSRRGGDGEAILEKRKTLLLAPPTCTESGCPAPFSASSPAHPAWVASLATPTATVSKGGAQSQRSAPHASARAPPPRPGSRTWAALRGPAAPAPTTSQQDGGGGSCPGDPPPAPETGGARPGGEPRTRPVELLRPNPRSSSQAASGSASPVEVTARICKVTSSVRGHSPSSESAGLQPRVPNQSPDPPPQPIYPHAPPPRHVTPRRPPSPQPRARISSPGSPPACSALIPSS